MPIEFLISMAASIIISAVKNPQTAARLQPLLFKIAAVIYAAAEQMGTSKILDQKIAEESSRLKPQP